MEFLMDWHERRRRLTASGGAGDRPYEIENLTRVGLHCVTGFRDFRALRSNNTNRLARRGRGGRRRAGAGRVVSEAFDFFRSRLMAVIHVTDASGRQWQYVLSPEAVCTIGRATDNNRIVLNDVQVSRYHAHIKHQDGGFVLVDGSVVEGQLRLSANHVFVNGQQRVEHPLRDGDHINIGASTLRFEQTDPVAEPRPVDYDDDPLGHTQVLLSTNELMQATLQPEPASPSANEELLALRRKADVLLLLYEMSKTLGSVFNLDAIFDKATDILLRVTPADRVLALLTDSGKGRTPGDDVGLKVVSMKVRDPRLQTRASHTSIGRTITRKVMRERAALLSQDAAADPEFAQVQSILSQGVRSTICAPIIADSIVHGALYADRLDPLSWFTRDDLELAAAVAAQTAMAVQNARAHERLAREEVARATYARFLPEYVVAQILENPQSFKLGGVNQTLTVLFADIRAFTRLAELAPPEKIVQLLNRYFSAMSDVIFKHGGTLDKYIGDGLMALFGAPAVTLADAGNAVVAAVEMQRGMTNVNNDLLAGGLPEINIGIGLHTGEATVGYIGSERRSEYTAIGDAVNLSSRLEGAAQPGQILVSEETKKAAGHMVYAFVPRGSITVKNREQPVQVFEVEW
jgi:adenylate cyclase